MPANDFWIEENPFYSNEVYERLREQVLGMQSFQLRQLDQIIPMPRPTPLPQDGPIINTRMNEGDRPRPIIPAELIEPIDIQSADVELPEAWGKKFEAMKQTSPIDPVDKFEYFWAESITHGGFWLINKSMCEAPPKMAPEKILTLGYSKLPDPFWPELRAFKDRYLCVLMPEIKTMFLFVKDNREAYELYDKPVPTPF